jgi:hypothetical protein
MKPNAAILLLALACGGCFGSDTALYQGVRPLTPLHAGAVTSRDKDGKIGHFQLSQDSDGSYRLVAREKGADFGKGYRMQFFALSGAPAGLVVAQVKDCGTDFKTCGTGSGWMYVLVRLAPGHAEWRDPDCSTALSKLSGLHVSIDSCKFADRDSLEKALRVVAQAPWQAAGAYTLAP